MDGKMEGRNVKYFVPSLFFKKVAENLSEDRELCPNIYAHLQTMILITCTVSKKSA